MVQFGQAVKSNRPMIADRLVSNGRASGTVGMPARRADAWPPYRLAQAAADVAAEIEMNKGVPLHRFDGRPLETLGHHPVDTPVVCVITRFGLRSPLSLLPTYLDYRRVVRQAKATRSPGLLRSLFVIESLRTCYSISIWENYEAIPRFGTNVPFHVTAARRIFGRVTFRHTRGPEVWSTKWRLDSVSNNLNWEDFDLRAQILSVAAA